MRGKSVRPDAKTFEDSEALSAAVSQDPGGIGYVGLPFIKSSKALAIQDGDGAALFPTVFTVATEDYALSRRLHLYTAAEPKNPLARPFLDYVSSDEGQRLVEQAGFVSLAVKAESPVFPPGTPPQYEAEVKAAYRLSVDFRFRTGSSELDTKAQPDLDRVIKYLSLPDNRQRHVMLHGFADSKGGDKVNVELSRTRAEVVAKELRRRGVLLEKSLGWGSTLPVATNESPEGRERNRRVEIWIR
jgi:phosphate transport system substrate-binding protein